MCFAPQQRALFPHLHFQKRSGPGGFCTFDFKMCFAPQRCARFRHLNFQNCSDAVSFSHFLLPIVLRSTKGVQFFHLSWGQLAPHPPLQRAYFSTLGSQQNIDKTQCFATFLPSSRICIFSLWFSSFLIFSISHLLPSGCLHAVLIVHIVGSLTSKFPSVIQLNLGGS